MATYHCAWCKDPFTARPADRNRGWALYCSKRCKAIHQTNKTGRGAPRPDQHDSSDEAGWDGHKVWT